MRSGLSCQARPAWCRRQACRAALRFRRGTSGMTRTHPDCQWRRASARSRRLPWPPSLQTCPLVRSRACRRSGESPACLRTLAWSFHRPWHWIGRHAGFLLSRYCCLDGRRRRLGEVGRKVLERAHNGIRRQAAQRAERSVEHGVRSRSSSMRRFSPRSIVLR